MAGRTSVAIRRAGQSWLPPLLLALFAAFELRHALGDGLPIFFDAHSHIGRSWMALRALTAGEYPSWSNDWYGGFRLLQFYSPGYYLYTAGLALVTGDIVSATKVGLWLGQIAATLAFYAFALRATERPLIAAFAALLMLRSSERIIVMEVIGNYPSLFVYLFAPLLLYAGLSLALKARRLFAALSLTLGAMWLGHLTNSLALLPGIASFLVASIWQNCEPGVERRRALAALLGSLLAAFLLTAFSTLPMLIDLPLALLSLSEVPLELDTTPLRTVLGLAPYSLDRPFARSHGLFWCLTGLVAAGLSLRSREARWRPFLVGLLVSLLSLVLLGERAAPGVGFFLFPLCGGAAAMLCDALAERGLPRVREWLPVLAITVVVLLPGDSHLPSVDYEPADSLAVYTTLPDTELPSRTFDITQSEISLDGFYGWSSFSPYFSGRAIPFGGFPQGAPLASSLAQSLASGLAAEMRSTSPTLSEDAADLLYLLNVEFLINRGNAELRRRTQLKLEDSSVLPQLASTPDLARRLGPSVLQLRHASPAIYAPRIERLPAPFAHDETSPRGRPQLLRSLEELWARDPLDQHPDFVLDLLFRTGARRDGDGFLPLLQALGINRKAHQAERFYVEDSAVPAHAESAEEVRFEVLRHREDLSSVEIELLASAPGFVRLSYNYDPELRLTLDRAPVRAYAGALLGAIVVAVPAGSHTIRIEPPPGSLRSALLGFSLLFTAGLAALLWIPRS